ncbi:MAG: tRNA 2-thiocytidine(32) synthetase TtcA [Acidiferrobacterales bacterium]|nr:tRNA 2-thiocytidine(32) synthetase TtcA [Acidiferrobacterales bacterium]
MSLSVNNRPVSSVELASPPRFDSPRDRYDFNKIRKRLQREVGNAIRDFGMISDQDRIMVCLSGGKDSYTLLDILKDLQQRAPVNFQVEAVNLDQKQPGFPPDVLPQYLESLNIPYHIIEADTYSIVRDVIEEGKTMCGLCSRLRRGILYNFADEHGFNKIALGHHRDDIVETLFLNMFHGGRIKAMPPKLRSDDGRNIVIRPLAYCKESDIQKYAAKRQFPIIPCNLCGSQEKLERVRIKKMLSEWHKEYPGRVENIFRSLQNISPSQLVDRNLFDFASVDSLGSRSDEKE